MVRMGQNEVTTYANLYPEPAPGSLFRGEAPEYIQRYWDSIADGRVDYTYRPVQQQVRA